MIDIARSAPRRRVAIFLAVLGFNLLGDAVRDAFDPRLRSLH